MYSVCFVLKKYFGAVSKSGVLVTQSTQREHYEHKGLPIVVNSLWPLCLLSVLRVTKTFLR